MRKQGPCRHCGITSTPLWRNGPPEKPVLCNACGSRWRTKGTLKNYTPLHCRGPLEEHAEEHSAAPKPASFHHIEEKLGRRKQDAQYIKNDCGNSTAVCVKDPHNVPHDNISNWSSSGSAISFAESCSHFSIADSSEVTGSLRSNISDCVTPSWKRKPETQPKASPVEKLTKDLHSILNQHPIYFMESSEEDLLYDNMPSVNYTDFGHGGFLIRHFNSTTRESGSTSTSPDLGSKRISIDSTLMEDIWGGRTNDSMNNGTKIVKMAQEHLESSLCQEECLIMLSRNCVLGSINLKDVISYDTFMTLTTPQDQEKLMKYLPSTDINKYPESLKMMFSSLQFEETLCNFQGLICEGLLDNSPHMENVYDHQTLQRLVLLMPTKCGWVEHYTRIKAAKLKQESRVAMTDHKQGSHVDLTCSTSLKRLNSSMAIDTQESKVMGRSSRKKSKAWTFDNHSPSSLSTNLSESVEEARMDHERSGFHSDNFFTSTLEKSCISDSPQPPVDNSYENLLIDVSSSSSFPEAVLLSALWEGKSS